MQFVGLRSRLNAWGRYLFLWVPPITVPALFDRPLPQSTLRENILEPGFSICGLF